jgi:uncharacterized protein (DUF2141 family)
VGLAAVIALVAGSQAIAQPTTGVPASLQFTVTGAESEGRPYVVCAVYPTEESWLETPLREVRARIHEGRATCVFDGLAPGRYGAAAYHDADGDRELDTNLFGAPTEGVAISRNAEGGAFSAPSWDDALFGIRSGGKRQLRARLRY